MDNRRSDRVCIEAALSALRGYGVEGAVLQGPGKGDRHDGEVQLSFGGKARRYRVEVKHLVTIATVPATVAAMQATRADLLVAPYVGPEAADWLRESETQFADAAGNAYLEAPGALVWVKGNRPAKDERAELRSALQRQSAARAFEPAGLKILFAFLCKSDLVNCSYREIAKTAGVAHGSVGWVMGELPHRGYVYDYGPENGGRRLKNVPELLAEWAGAYARKLRPNIILGRYTAKDPQWWSRFHPQKYHALLGGELAAEKITRHLRPGLFTLYVRTLDSRLLIDYGLRPDPAGTIEVAQHFWNFETKEADESVAPLPLVYADLLATADPRAIEAAQLIRERFLAARPD